MCQNLCAGIYVCVRVCECMHICVHAHVCVDAWGAAYATAQLLPMLVDSLIDFPPKTCTQIRWSCSYCIPGTVSAPEQRISKEGPY